MRLVLKAYAMYNVKTGYCQVRGILLWIYTLIRVHLPHPQAMAPVAATLLMHMTPEVTSDLDGGAN